MSDPTAKLPRRLRFEILRRDDHTCRYCGARAPDVQLTVDHVVPVSLGGQHDPTNLVTACCDCNRGKASSSPDAALVDDVSESARQWAAAVKAAAEVLRQDDGEFAETVAGFYDFYTRSCRWSPPKDWDGTIVTFLHRGLSGDDLKHFARIATSKRLDWNETWRYFCGCCWKRITQIDALAKNVFEAQRQGDE